MLSLRTILPTALGLAFFAGLALIAWAHPGHSHDDDPLDAASRPLARAFDDVSEPETSATPSAKETAGSSRSVVLATSLTVFALAIFVGFEVISKVPPTLHTPLMSGSNAISGITVVGAILAAGQSRFGFATALGMVAVALAMVNVVGGFVVTDRMLRMFKRR